MCKRKKREEGKRWVKRVKEARTEGQVWEIINRERKKVRKIDGIEGREWRKYFIDLLGGVEGRVVWGRGREGIGEI